jgi:hypothetical protein
MVYDNLVDNAGEDDANFAMNKQTIDLKNLDVVYCFQKSSLEKALQDWQHEQIAAFPDKKEQIDVVALAMLDFMCSRHVLDHGMVVTQLLEKALHNKKSSEERK